MSDFLVPHEWPVESDGLRYITHDLRDSGLGGMVQHLLLGQMEGEVFALLPAKTDERYIFAFMRSYFVDHPQPYPDLDPWVLHQVQRCSAGGGQAFVYDKFASPDNLKRFPRPFLEPGLGYTVSFENQLLYGFDPELFDAFNFTAMTSHCICNDPLVLCSNFDRRLSDGETLSEADARAIVSSTTLLFARAYDGEGWLLWRQT